MKAHFLWSRITKYICSSTTPNLLSVLDPGSTVFLPWQDRKDMSPPSTEAESKAVCFLKHNTLTFVSVLCFASVLPPGIEPGVPVPQTNVLSIKLRERMKEYIKKKY